MKTYFRSLFPWRWIIPFAFILMASFLQLIMFSLNKTPANLAIVYLIATAIGLLLFDYIFGLGQLSIWERRAEARKILITLQCKQTIIHDRKIYVTEDEFKTIANAETIASESLNKEVFNILRRYLTKEDKYNTEELTDITIDVA